MLLRVVNNANYLAVTVHARDPFYGKPTEIEGFLVIGGVDTGRFYATLPWYPTTSTSIVAFVVGSRVWIFAGLPGGTLAEVCSFQHEAIGTTLATGDVYVYDENTTLDNFVSRYYEQMSAWPVEEEPLCLAGKNLEIRSDGILRQNSDGTVYGRVVPRSGQLPYAAPSYLEGRPTRGIIIPSQSDLQGLMDVGSNKIAHKALYYPGYHFASEAGASTYAELFIKRAKELGAAYILAPTLEDHSLANKGSAPGVPAASLLNGAVLSNNGLIPGAQAAVLDGVNDYIDTGWTTRTNRIPDPLFAQAINVSWTTLRNGESATKFTPNVALACEPAGTATACLVECDGKSPSSIEGAQLVTAERPVVTPGEQLTVSAYVKAKSAGDVGKQVGIYVRLVNSEGVTVKNYPNTEPGTFVELSLEWQRVSHTVTVDAESAKVAPFFAGTSTGTSEGAFSFYLAAPMVGDSGAYFPNPAQLESGLAGWSGTANRSASDIGPFARGTARTFVALAERSSLVAGAPIIGGGNTTYVRVAGEGPPSKIELNFSTTVRSFPGKWPGESKVVQIAAIFDDPNDLVRIAVNGGALESQAATDQFPGPTESRTTLQIGKRGSSFWPGDFGPFAVFTRALSAEEIESMYY
jgi:hypothetical protein